MGTVTVKLPTAAHKTLSEFAAADKRSMGEVLADLIDREEGRRFFEAAEAGYARLRADPEAWADYQAELRSMEGSLMDGLEEDPWVE